MTRTLPKKQLSSQILPHKNHSQLLPGGLRSLERYPCSILFIRSLHHSINNDTSYMERHCSSSSICTISLKKKTSLHPCQKWSVLACSNGGRGENWYSSVSATAKQLHKRAKWPFNTSDNSQTPTVRRTEGNYQSCTKMAYKLYSTRLKRSVQLWMTVPELARHCHGLKIAMDDRRSLTLEPTPTKSENVGPVAMAMHENTLLVGTYYRIHPRVLSGASAHSRSQGLEYTHFKECPWQVLYQVVRQWNMC